MSNDDPLRNELALDNDRLRKAIEKLSVKVKDNEDERWKNLESKVDKLLVLLVGNEDEVASKRAVFSRLRELEEQVLKIENDYAERAKKRVEEQRLQAQAIADAKKEKRQDVSAWKLAIFAVAVNVLWELLKAGWHKIFP